jgi:Ca2+-binding EF-hand superfamily protein
VCAAEIEEAMKQVDINGDELLDYDEFITAAMSHSLLQRVR